MPRTEDKTKKIAYKILGTPANMQKADKSGSTKRKGKKKEK